MALIAKLMEREPLQAELTARIEVIDVAGDYEGEYEVTPSEKEQRLATAGKILAQEIVIYPIPSYWGRITRNGDYIRVS